MITDNRPRCECQVCRDYGPYELRGPHPEFPDQFPADFWPLPYPHDMKRNPNMKYMLIDVTTIGATCFVAIAGTKETPLIAKIMKATQPGKQLIAPPLEGRGFSKISLEQLQYLYWNSTQQAPQGDFGVLVQLLREHAEKMPVDATPLETLEAEVKRLYPDEPAAASTTPSAPREPRVPGEAPKATSTTGKVWVIADVELTKSGHKDLVGGVNIKDLRVAIMKACTAEGINEATAATQYSKWKASKMAGKTA